MCIHSELFVVEKTKYRECLIHAAHCEFDFIAVECLSQDLCLNTPAIKLLMIQTSTNKDGAQNYVYTQSPRQLTLLL